MGRSVPTDNDEVARDGSGAEGWTGRFAQWIDWYFEVRWRALVTWVALAFVSGAGLVSGRDQVDEAVAVVVSALKSYVGISLPVEILRVFNLLALVSWFQPLALRLSLLRGILWIMAYAATGVAVLQVFARSPGSYRWLEYILLAHLFGLPGLVCIGSRTRAWLSVEAGSLSVALMLVIFRMRPETVWYGAGIMLATANLPYAAIMLYGTRLIRRDRGQF